MGQVGEGLSGFRVAQKLDLVEMRGPRYIKVEKGRKEETYLVWVWRNSGAVDLVSGRTSNLLQVYKGEGGRSFILFLEI